MYTVNYGGLEGTSTFFSATSFLSKTFFFIRDFLLSATFFFIRDLFSRGEGTLYNGLYGEAPPERGTFFGLEVYKRVGISRAEV